MAIDANLFESPPYPGATPTPSQWKAMASMAAGWRAGGRKEIMNEIGRLLGIPPGGWGHGLSRLFADGDIRLVALLRSFLNDGYCRAAARNLARARQYLDAEVMLALCTAARENSRSVAASGKGKINTYDEGGLDFLWKEKERLGLPKAITDRWEPVEEFVNEESGSYVYPALIPENDQVLAYAAQINSSFQRHFTAAVRTFVSPDPGVLFGVSRVALIVWKAYAFLAPHGRRYDRARTVAAQSGQPFGLATAVEFLADRLKGRPAASILDGITSEPDLNHVEWVRIAKARAAEALFMERLWITSSDLIPF